MLAKLCVIWACNLGELGGDDRGCDPPKLGSPVDRVFIELGDTFLLLWLLTRGGGLVRAVVAFMPVVFAGTLAARAAAKAFPSEELSEPRGPALELRSLEI